MTEGHAPAKNGNGSGGKLLTVDTLIKILLAVAALISSYQRVIDKIDYLEREVADVKLWKDTETQVTNSHDRRLTIIETEGWRPTRAPEKGR